MMYKHGHSVLKIVDHSKYFEVKIVPALLDNYMYIIVDKYKKEAAVIDPVEPERIKDILDDEELQCTLKSAFITHHHWDHAGGNTKLLTLYPGIEIYAGDDRTEGYTKLVKNNQVLKIGNLTVCCMSSPCHTSGHMSYYVTGNHGESPALFSGDSIFLSGCGKFFEGSAAQMFDNMQTLTTLPKPTRIYCGHELTVMNLKFAYKEDPGNLDLADRLEWAKKCRTNAVPTVPSTVEEEMRFNPFVTAINATVLDELRQRRNRFRSHKKNRDSITSLTSSASTSPVDRSGAASAASSGISC
ncbi:uncharacterized protein LOC129583250 [Paramacrobiotus metropolitanus]|uniref:uncharacterized protein LOC129583250 n=1 Tax=Paramacrobiotus metropolitanus TaxID=2943436 RepID=UPI002445CB39|nr:uncharacterized protein LOC129583250 [Paramacrobiotus metropolitanus]